MRPQRAESSQSKKDLQAGITLKSHVILVARIFVLNLLAGRPAFWNMSHETSSNIQTLALYGELTASDLHRIIVPPIIITRNALRARKNILIFCLYVQLLPNFTLLQGWLKSWFAQSPKNGALHIFSYGTRTHFFVDTNNFTHDCSHPSVTNLGIHT